MLAFHERRWIWLWGGMAALALAGATTRVLTRAPHADPGAFQIDFIDERIQVSVEMVSPDEPAVSAGPPGAVW